MNLTWKRTLRTPSSERFLAQRGGNDVAAVDLHYLTNGTIAGTVIILKDSGLDESNIQPLLSALDDECDECPDGDDSTESVPNVSLGYAYADAQPPPPQTPPRGARRALLGGAPRCGC